MQHKLSNLPSNCAILEGVRQLKWFIIGFLIVLISLGSYLWFDRTKVETKVIDAYLKKVAPSLPFKIESYHLGRNLDSLDIHLLWKQMPITLAGPLKVKWLGKEGLSFHYQPDLTAGDASPVKVEIESEISIKLELIDGVRVSIAPQALQSKLLGLSLKEFTAAIDFDHGVLTTGISAKSLAWTDAQHTDHAINADQLHFELKLPDVHEPYRGDFLATAKSSEVLWDKLYADLKLEAYPLAIHAESKELVQINLGKKHELLAQIISTWQDQELKHAVIHWKSSALDLSVFAPWLIKTLAPSLTTLQNFKDLEVKAGSLKTSGQLFYSPALAGVKLRALQLDGCHLSLRSLSHHFTLKDLNFSLPYHAQEKSNALSIEVGTVYYKHFAGALKQTIIHWNSERLETASTLPLEIQNIALAFGKISAQFSPNFSLSTSLELPKSNLNPLLAGLCIPTEKLPPASIEAKISGLNFSPGVIEPTGKMELSAFKGQLEINDIGFYDLETEVPELNFDAEWRGIDMQAVGEWSKFGEIKGTLEGYAHNVVFQSYLPTQYHFLIQVLPLDRGRETARVEFSPEAMKNVVKVFTGTSLDEQMPGIAGWLMFGWPSRVFGGYDVNYAGIKLTSEDGRIVVETLDLPGIFAKERKHFVLYGPRFKMPLRNSNYPLLIDATSMSNFVHQLMVQLSSIKKKKEGTEDHEEAPIECDPPEL